MTNAELGELKADMLERTESGLDPLEHPILIYEGRILDGRHRFDAWNLLAAEGAFGGFFARNRPPMERFTPGRHGTLLAWMRAKSANMVQRHIPADQKAAIFLKAVEQFPELKVAVEEIEAENAERKKAGRPSGAGARRSTTAEQVGKLAGVGATTVKQVKRLREAAPERFEEVAQGRKTVKKALKEVQTEEVPSATALRGGASGKALKAGDTFYCVGPISPSGDCPLQKHIVKAVDGVVYVTVGGKRILRKQAVTLEKAKEERKALLGKRIRALEADIVVLKGAIRQEPTITSA